jgi:S1-C subfamily serine protease
MKKFLVLIFCILLAGCFTTASRKNFVNSRVENPYLASVSITDRKGDASGSGTIIWNKKNNYLMVITAAHVIESMEERKKAIHITFTYSGAIKPMRVLKINHEKDLALLVGNSKEIADGPYVEIATSRPDIGDDVWAIGSPLGLKYTTTKGNLSNFEEEEERSVYRFTAPVFFGNSGGGLFNDKGELIGVVYGFQYLRLNVFSIMAVPGAFYAVSLKEIRKFL